MLEVTSDMDKVRMGSNVVYFTAEWCQPCKQLKPQFARAGTLDKMNNYFIIDIESIDKKYLEEYNIKSVPQMFIMNNGTVVKKIDSKVSSEILNEVNSVLV
jgi:hypothetical protein